MRVTAFPTHLDSNPYCDLLYSNLIELGVDVCGCSSFSFGWLLRNRYRIDILHFHWIERLYRHWRGGYYSYVTLALFILRILFAKLLGYKIVWTMHNLTPHESKNREVDMIAVAFMARSALTAVHCERAKTILKSRARKAKVFVIPHGNYIDVYPARAGKKESRTELGLPQQAKVFLFFGMIRMYKGIRELCISFSRAADKNSILLVVGKPYEEREGEMVDSMMGEFASAQIKFIIDFVPDNEVAKYFLACDFAVFPYRDILTSGSVILSLGFGRPIIVPRIGCLAELEEYDLGIFYDPTSAGGLEGAIERALRTERRDAMSQNARAYAEELDWGKIACKYFCLYKYG